jgi:hypothetical protein
MEHTTETMTPEQQVQQWIMALLTKRASTPVCDYAFEEYIVEKCALAIDGATYSMVRRELSYLVTIGKVCKYELFIRGDKKSRGTVYALPSVPTYRSL